jgi:(p)ppGpp synthase/HD superfamily hydrolase
MSTLERAIEIAVAAHKGQKDKSGAPYILHPLRVMEMGASETEKICGILHDLVEDTAWTFEDLEKEGFSDEIIGVLQLLTKESDTEDYVQFIQRVMTHKTAVAVKLNDLRDNMDITRLNELKGNDLQRLNKYLNAYHRLREKQSAGGVQKINPGG